MKVLAAAKQTVKWLRGEPRRCGACLFELHPTAKPRAYDLQLHPVMIFWLSDSYLVKYRDMESSARRGCEKCQRITALLAQAELKPSAIEWYPGQSYGDLQGIRTQIDVHPASGNQVIKFELCVSPEYQQPPITQRPFKDTRPHPCICSGTKVIGGTGDTEVLSQAAMWLNECRAKHPRCQRKDPTFVPTRLLSIAGEDPLLVYLVENQPGPLEYAALSHRWSEETMAIRLETAALVQRKHTGLLLSDLPQMMQDTVRVLRTFGLAFVWIDCLCIIQDDVEDWRREAGKMASIYSNAELIIAATWCHGSEESLFSSRKAAKFIISDIAQVDGHPIFLRRSPPHFLENSLMNSASDEDTADNPLQDWPLLSRGWVYQEQWLAHRVLYFTGHELSWVCNEAMACECARYRFSSVSDAEFSGRNTRVKPKEWTEIIEEYSVRAFTKTTDRLPALAGIASAFAESEDSGLYLCGHWAEELQHTLLWRLEAPVTLRQHTGMPTWSWASVTGRVSFQGGYDDGIEVLDSRIISIGDPYMGEVKEASLLVSGAVIPTVLYYGQSWLNIITSAKKPLGAASYIADEWNTEVYGIAVQDHSVTFIADYKLDAPGDHYIPAESPVLCLLSGSNTIGERDPEHPENDREESYACGLVLRCVDEATSSYERIGYFKGWDWDNAFRWDIAESMSYTKQLTLV